MALLLRDGTLVALTESETPCLLNESTKVRCKIVGFNKVFDTNVCKRLALKGTNKETIRILKNISIILHSNAHSISLTIFQFVKNKSHTITQMEDGESAII